MKPKYVLRKSKRKYKRYAVTTPQGKTIHFGSKDSNYTLHKDKERKARYIARHRKNENWCVSGINTSGFWAHWILWNKPSLSQSIKNTEKRFKIKIEF